ncbi:sigma-70 family RNA polymerase sigma factor [Dyadobacter chenwenxiniae]|uniref:Sigma-70 family RNA polymerase sigma factor n=1 Tax=Dyadobacter chenwenxiniae TaxID=2906456 RepID=A0A9X1PJH5_9BACT|nr:sigma-70 family RNA polymerase sigma factor [Dyadobacter chenwenxiniae]MCF0048685.1 sigma-70 family RNA polymerase sigma factor [Dyadobacter chenwenxiniae]MCF0062477.1 sigma-70 family RNA polymerase sigma factor [Dyadobacter chenwenxiniae]UON83775.1 sigma-70 family RNA polymerase sigma factor [Dyadobacter chenwenxiniae]
MRFLRIFRGNTAASLSEAQQLRAYRSSGDVGVLGALYEPYMEMVFAVCFKYLRDEDACKDAVMQIFEKLVVELRTHEVEHFKSWLHSVCRNFCLMQLRARKTFVTAHDIDNEHDETLLIATGPEEPLFYDRQFDALEMCLGTLQTEQRMTIQLFYMQEKCYKEISEETGFDLNKVKSYIQNGKRNLKICIERNGRE